MTDQTPQVRAIATQLIRHAIKQIDSEVACDHIVATLGEGVDVDALAFGSESAVRKARIDISWDGAPAAPPLSPVVQSPVREQLLNAIDATFCQSLGYATPEGLLAAYEASRTQTVDRDALRDRIDATLRTTRRIGHGTHRYDARCALCAGDVDALTEALAAAVLPATTNHDTDTSVTHRCAECGSGFVPGSDVELTHNCDDHRDAEPAPVDRAAVLREAAQRLYTALFPAVYADMGQKAAEGVNRAVSELRRMADETAATETQDAAWGVCQGCGAAAGPDCDCPPFAEQQTVPVQHAPGKAVRCPDCRAKGYTVCLDGPADAAPQRSSAARYLDAFLHRGPGYDLTPAQPAAGARQAETATPPCVECDHPKADHGEGEDPVTPGQCQACPDDDAWHDYRAASGARQDGADRD